MASRFSSPSPPPRGGVDCRGWSCDDSAELLQASRFLVRFLSFFVGVLDVDECRRRRLDFILAEDEVVVIFMSLESSLCFDEVPLALVFFVVVLRFRRGGVVEEEQQEVVVFAVSVVFVTIRRRALDVLVLILSWWCFLGFLLRSRDDLRLCLDLDLDLRGWGDLSAFSFRMSAGISDINMSFMCRAIVWKKPEPLALHDAEEGGVASVADIARRTESVMLPLVAVGCPWPELEELDPEGGRPRALPMDFDTAEVISTRSCCFCFLSFSSFCSASSFCRISRSR